MWGAAGDHNYMGHICAKGILDLNFDYAVIDKISNFQEIDPNSTYYCGVFSPQIVIFKV